jgi:zinc protease
VAEIQIWAQVGSADETEGELGLAHFHEHMLFKGTARRGVGEIAGEVEGAGGRINAFTSFDVTAYHATLPSDRIEVGIDVLCDAVQHSRFDPDEIAREIEVVIEEINRSEDSPGHVLGDAIFAEAYHVHPYRRPILGSAESVASFDQAKIRAFYDRWYAPDNLTAVVVGDFDTRSVIASLAQHFADAEPRGVRRERPAEPPQRGMRTTLLTRPFERTHLDLSWPGVSLAHPDAALLDLLAFVLGGCESSRLVRRVKEREGLADRIDASSYTPLDPGTFSVSLETDAERAGDAIQACVREVARLRIGAVTAGELEIARTNFLAGEHFERESVTGVANKLGSFHLFAGDYNAETRYLDAVRSATPEQLYRVAAEHLAPERLTVGGVIHEGATPVLDEALVKESVEHGLERCARTFAVPDSLSASDEMQSYRLPGGAELHVVPRREVPVVAARAVFLGGLLAEDERSSGLTSFLGAMWLRGTRSRSAADFARATESLAAEIDCFTGRSSFGLTLETPSERIEPTLDLFAEVLLEPSFDRDEIERERRDTLAAIARREDRLAQLAFLLFAKTHYPHHPYRQPLLGSAESVASFDRDAIAAHHARLVRSANLALAVVGDVDPDEIAVQVSARLADLDAGSFEAPSPPMDDAPTEVRHAELRKDRAQAHLVIGFRGLTVHDDDRFALEVVSQLLAGQGGRLFLDLRDRQGLAYTVSAMNVEGIAPGYFGVYIATAPEKLDAARRGLLEGLEALTQAAPSDAELDRSRRHLIGNFAIDQQRNAVRAAHAAINARYGLGAEAERAYPERIAAVSAEDALRVARRIVDLSAYTEALVHP